MNITNNQTTDNTSQTTLKDNTSSTNAEKISATKREEKKDTQTSSSEEKSEFQKYLEEPQSTDKANLEQVQQLHQNPNIINEQYINKFGFDTVSSLQNLKTSYNYDTVKISKDDAKFFADLVENKQFALQQNGETQNLIKFADEIGPTYKTQQTSQILTDLISKAYNEQKPVRIDFDNNVTVVLKVDTKGKVSAEFIPGDKAVEMYLRNNIGFLKQRFDDQNIPYNDILYRHSNNGNKQKERQNQQNKGD